MQQTRFDVASAAIIISNQVYSHIFCIFLTYDAVEDLIIRSEARWANRSSFHDGATRVTFPCVQLPKYVYDREIVR